jgi:hypothetical protein
MRQVSDRCGGVFGRWAESIKSTCEPVCLKGRTVETRFRSWKNPHLRTAPRAGEPAHVQADLPKDVWRTLSGSASAVASPVESSMPVAAEEPLTHSFSSSILSICIWLSETDGSRVSSSLNGMPSFASEPRAYWRFGFQRPVTLPSGSANQANVPEGIATGGTTVFPPSPSM